MTCAIPESCFLYLRTYFKYQFELFEELLCFYLPEVFTITFHFNFHINFHFVKCRSGNLNETKISLKKGESENFR